MKAICALAVGLLLLLALGGCSIQCGNPTPSDTGTSTSSPSASTAKPAAGTKPGAKAEGGPQVVALVTGDEYDAKSKKITHESVAFTPETKVIHITAALQGLKPGADLKGVLMAISVTAKSGQKIANREVASAHMAAPGANSDVHFNFSAPTAGWPKGSYTLTIFVDDKSIGGQDVTVK